MVPLKSNTSQNHTYSIRYIFTYILISKEVIHNPQWAVTFISIISLKYTYLLMPKTNFVYEPIFSYQNSLNVNVKCIFSSTCQKQDHLSTAETWRVNIATHHSDHQYKSHMIHVLAGVPYNHKLYIWSSIQFDKSIKAVFHRWIS